MLKIVFAALLLPTCGASASIESLVTQADAVIIGVGGHPVKDGRVVVLPLLAERVFKGPVAPGTVVNVNWDSGTDDILWKTPPVLHGLWFLRSSTNGWEIISAKPNQSKALSNLLYPTSSGPLPPALAYGDDDPLSDKLILEVGAVPICNPSDILHATSGSNSSAVMRLFRYLVQSKSIEEKLAGLAGLLQRGDNAAIQQLETDSGNLSSSRAFPRVAAAVAFAFRTDVPESVNALGRIATAQKHPAKLRSAAAQALSAIHTREALPHLAALLDDPNPELVSYGIVGLSFFANGVGTQTTAGMPTLEHLNKRQPSNYRTSETEQHLGLDASRRQEFQDFWRRWWNANRASLVK